MVAMRSPLQWSWLSHFHFADEETEAKGDEMTSPQTHRDEAATGQTHSLVARRPASCHGAAFTLPGDSQGTEEGASTAGPVFSPQKNVRKL